MQSEGSDQNLQKEGPRRPHEIAERVKGDQDPIQAPALQHHQALPGFGVRGEAASDHGVSPQRVSERVSEPEGLPYHGGEVHEEDH